jgi:protein-arginine kinase activator protein McsA
MARKYESKKVEREEKWCVERTCDICGATAQYPDAGHWDAKSSYDVSQVTIACKEGTSFPEGRNVTVTSSFEICMKCFHDTLTPMLKSVGAKPFKTEKTLQERSEPSRAVRSQIQRLKDAIEEASRRCLDGESK